LYTFGLWSNVLLTRSRYWSASSTRSGLLFGAAAVEAVGAGPRCCWYGAFADGAGATAAGAAGTLPAPAAGTGAPVAGGCVAPTGAAPFACAPGASAAWSGPPDASGAAAGGADDEAPPSGAVAPALGAALPAGGAVAVDARPGAPLASLPPCAAAPPTPAPLPPASPAGAGAGAAGCPEVGAAAPGAAAAVVVVVVAAAAPAGADGATAPPSEGAVSDAGGAFSSVVGSMLLPAKHARMPLRAEARDRERQHARCVWCAPRRDDRRQCDRFAPVNFFYREKFSSLLRRADVSAVALTLAPPTAAVGSS
jgi:hypothetical protein